MDRPKRKVARINYKTFNEFGTSETNNIACQYLLQKMTDEVQLPADEDDVLDLMEDETKKLNEAAAMPMVYATPLKSQKRIAVSQTLENVGTGATIKTPVGDTTNSVGEHDSDEELELRVKLLEEKKTDQEGSAEQTHTRVRGGSRYYVKARS